MKKKKKLLRLRKPRLAAGAVHYIGPKNAKYLCGKKIKWYKFTKVPANVTCVACTIKLVMAAVPVPA